MRFQEQKPCYSRMDDLIERRAVGRMAIQKDLNSRKRTQSNYPAWSPKAKEENSKQLPSMVTKSQGRELKATTQHGHLTLRERFNWVSKVIPHRFDIASLHSVIGPEDSHHKRATSLLAFGYWVPPSLNKGFTYLPPSQPIRYNLRFPAFHAFCLYFV